MESEFYWPSMHGMGMGMVRLPLCRAEGYILPFLPFVPFSIGAERDDGCGFMARCRHGATLVKKTTGGLE